MQFSGMTPNILNICVQVKKGEGFACKIRYFDHKEQLQFFSVPIRHHTKSTLSKR
jgi:hypothetical protein